MNRALALALLLAGCGVRHPPAPAPAPHYVVGSGYQMGGAWYYPREDFSYDATGIAAPIPACTGLTADGEPCDPAALAGAHQTLQLPSVVRVTNLENGRQLLLRLDDRGPAQPSRVLGLTKRAADLLGITGPTRVRVQVESEPSQALRDQLQGAPSGVVAAPRGAVAEQSLPPPPGVRQSARFGVATVQQTAAADSAQPAAVLRLPETVTQVAPDPGTLWIWAGQFGRETYANVVKAKLYGLPVRVARVPATRPPQYRVEIGPFPTIADADAALDRARAAGVTDAQIVVE